MTQEPKQPAPKPPAPDLLGDFQRWLMKSSARSLGREVRGNVRKTLGHRGSRAEDVWSVATSEVPEEPPECEWCPVCRAARKFRDSDRGPGLGSHLSSAGEAFASVLNDAVSAFETAVSTAKQPPGSGAAGTRPAGPGAGAGTAQATAPAPAGTAPGATAGGAGAGGPAAAGPQTAAGPGAAAAGPGAAAAGPGVKKPGPKGAGGASRATAAGAKAAAGAGTGRPAAAGPKRSAGTAAGKSAGTGAKAPGGTKPRKPPAAAKAGPDAGAWAEAADPVTRAAKRPAAGGSRERAVDDPDDRG